MNHADDGTEGAASPDEFPSGGAKRDRLLAGDPAWPLPIDEATSREILDELAQEIDDLQRFVFASQWHHAVPGNRRLNEWEKQIEEANRLFLAACDLDVRVRHGPASEVVVPLVAPLLERWARAISPAVDFYARVKSRSGWIGLQMRTARDVFKTAGPRCDERVGDRMWREHGRRGARVFIQECGGQDDTRRWLPGEVASGRFARVMQRDFDTGGAAGHMTGVPRVHQPAYVAGFIDVVSRWRP